MKSVVARIEVPLKSPVSLTSRSFPVIAAAASLPRIYVLPPKTKVPNVLTPIAPAAAVKTAALISV